MKRMILLALASTALMTSVAANAAPLVAGAPNTGATAGLPPGPGAEVLATQSTSGTAFTFAATFNQMVVRNKLGTLDFYFQVIRTGAGTIANNEIRSFSVGSYAGLSVEAFAFGGDVDGAGAFVAANNPTLANGTPSGSTTTFGLSPNGSIVTAEFGINGLTGTESSATYILRTNATFFNGFGTFGIIDGSTLQGLTFQPSVPEPATWGMMMLGVGMIGGTMRYRRRKATVAFA